jgi:hypothetical protein
VRYPTDDERAVQAEAIALQAEALLKKYRDHYGDIPE